MNCSAEKSSRKWANGRRVTTAMVTAAAALLILGMQAGSAAAARRSLPSPWAELFGDGPPRVRKAVRRVAVPLPRPRPPDAPAAPDRPEAAKQPPAKADKGADTASEEAAAATQPSACRLALTEAIAIAPSIPDIRGPGGCGGEDLVRLEAIVLPDKRQVSVKPAAILRCKMAAAIADWIRTDIAPLARSQGSAITDLDNFDSYECRGRNRVSGAQLSEHGRANALDIRAFKLANGRAISLTDRTVPRELRESVLRSTCARFPTVLGPGSDGYHEDHIHLDLIERRSNYRICQWNVWDPLPQVAPLLPARRPDEAPPREVAATSNGERPEPAKPDTAKSGDVEPEPAAAAPTPTKKRRQDRRS